MLNAKVSKGVCELHERLCQRRTFLKSLCADNAFLAQNQFKYLPLLKQHFSSPVSTQLCNTIADDLTRTADNVVQLYKRLTIDKEDEGASIDRDTMLRGLQSSVNETMRTLRLVVAGGQASVDGSATTGTENVVVNEATATFQELLAGQDQGKVVNMMQQYSELLLTMMQQRMGGPQSSHT